MVMSKTSCKFILLVLATLNLVACGKEVEDVKRATIEASPEADTGLLTIDYQHSAFTAVQTVIPRNANFRIPESFSFTAEAKIQHPFQVFYNTTTEPFTYEFKCTYLPNFNEKRFYLQHCFNSIDSNLGNVVGIDFMLDEGKVILMESQETNSFHAFIHHRVVWK